MPYNLLLLPLVGGFIFISRWHRTRYFALRSEGHRLILNAAIAGALFLLLAAFLTGLLGPRLPRISNTWHGLVPFPFSGTSVLAAILGGVLWFPLNNRPFTRIWTRSSEISRTIYRKGDPLEILLYEALVNFRPVMLTLTTNKIYVGFVIRNFNPAFPLNYIAILPAVSGYREQNHQSVCFDTSYLDLYQDIENNMPNVQGLSSADFEIVLPVADIRSGRIFDVEIYENYFAEDEADTEDEGLSEAID